MTSFKEKKKLTILSLIANPRKSIHILKGKISSLFFQLDMAIKTTSRPLKIYPVIYIRTPKCASSSIIFALSAASRIIQLHGRKSSYKETELSEENLKRKIIFMSPGMIDWFREKYPSIWDKAYKFSVIRNPYDKAISAWKFLDDLKILSLTEALENPPQPNNQRSHHHFTKSLASMLTVDGKLCTDYLMRYETINEDFAVLMNHLGLQGISLPETNKTFSRTKNGYEDYLDERSRALINTMYHDDFETFGYVKE